MTADEIATTITRLSTRLNEFVTAQLADDDQTICDQLEAAGFNATSDTDLALAVGARLAVALLGTDLEERTAAWRHYQLQHARQELGS